MKRRRIVQKEDWMNRRDALDNQIRSNKITFKKCKFKKLDTFSRVHAGHFKGRRFQLLQYPLLLR